MVETFPTLTPSSAEFGLQSNTQTFTSDLDGSSQTLELPGARWVGRLDFPPLNNTNRRAFQAFLAKLRGQAGRFYYGDPFYEGASGVATGTPLVNGASQTGSTIITDGWTASQTGILKAGDYISFDTTDGRELHMVVADANSDGSGNATLTIEPPIRTAPADNAAIEVTSPTCIFRLSDDAQTKWALAGIGNDGTNYAGFTILIVESFK